MCETTTLIIYKQFFILISSCTLIEHYSEFIFIRVTNLFIAYKNKSEYRRVLIIATDLTILCSRYFTASRATSSKGEPDDDVPRDFFFFFFLNLFLRSCKRNLHLRSIINFPVRTRARDANCKRMRVFICFFFFLFVFLDSIFKSILSFYFLLDR